MGTPDADADAVAETQREVCREYLALFQGVVTAREAVLRAAEEYVAAKERLWRLQNKICKHPRKTVTDLQQSQERTECPDCGYSVRD